MVTLSLTLLLNVLTVDLYFLQPSFGSLVTGALFRDWVGHTVILTVFHRFSQNFGFIQSHSHHRLPYLQITSQVLLMKATRVPTTPIFLFFFTLISLPLFLWQRAQECNSHRFINSPPSRRLAEQFWCTFSLIRLHRWHRFHRGQASWRFHGRGHEWRWCHQH